MNNILQLQLHRLQTPIGEMLVVTDREGFLRAIDWTEYEPRMQRLLQSHYGQTGFSLSETEEAPSVIESIRRYFAGDLDAINDLPVKTEGTPFQREVWQALREIPTGTTISYGQLAERIGRPAAVRAVGLANGSNPVGLVVPCHRVIGANGSMTGYGGGIERKRWLLEHEGHLAASLPLG